MMAKEHGPTSQAAGYRKLAGLALKLAIVSDDKKSRGAYLHLAKNWNALAADTEYPVH